MSRMRNSIQLKCGEYVNVENSTCYFQLLNFNEFLERKKNNIRYFSITKWNTLEKLKVKNIDCCDNKLAEILSVFCSDKKNRY